jgi:hypothetical protein
MAELHLLEDSDSDFSDHRSAKKSVRGKKSGRSKTVHDVVLKDIDWPHYYVYHGADRQGARYEDLAVHEFVFGYLCQVLDGVDSQKNKNIMLAHLRDLMCDTMDYQWVTIRNFHAVLLGQLEMNRITWDDTEKITSLRQTYVQRAPTPRTSKVPPSRGSSYRKSQQTCPAYQQGACSHRGDHESASGMLIHACAFCMNTTGYGYRHADRECRRKQRVSKNDQGDLVD